MLLSDKYRILISISGNDAKSFLQNIVTTDINELSDKDNISCQYSLLLSPQGKILYDFFILLDKNFNIFNYIFNAEDIIDDNINNKNELNSQYYLACHPNYVEDIYNKLKIYKIKSSVDIKIIKNLRMLHIICNNNIICNKNFNKFDKFDDKFENNQNNISNYIVKYTDPRFLEFQSSSQKQLFFSLNITSELVIVELDYFTKLFSNYRKYEMNMIDDLMLKIKMPQFGHDFFPNEYFPFDFSLENIGAISFDKGCYIGQEVITRTKFRNKIRQKLYHLYPLTIDDILINRGDKVMINIDSNGLTKNIGKVVGIYPEQKLLTLLKIEDIQDYISDIKSDIIVDVCEKKYILRLQ
ncbi:CAF17-like 4Fe-4S cluster assembly/insertion protein YgfZ [Lyticum sinuosum]|uniref:Folate-binding protein YgfZ n=1 Tax=Lyticum sinuosum TaxID=1332059 RepID=A0AAE5AHW6_9RICK|nr:hypothetical protein [Lyticum sinuosum]MDZ5761269.1 Folate-binding protein YgfZ [Lyticum sinuosum]